MLIDTHCHIQDTDFESIITRVLQNAKDAGVVQLVAVGADGESSEAAVRFAQQHEGCFASVGLHPHDAKLGEDTFETIARLATEKKVVAIGECGLDYYYDNSPKADQQRALEYQLYLARSLNLPCIFHVRDAFDDFWPIFDRFSGLRGVVHSFSATPRELDQVLSRGLYVGLNGIMTFTKDEKQLAAAQAVPLEKLLLETDAPFLTPPPKRGTMNEPANVDLVAAFLARLRGESLEVLHKATTDNARSLYRLTSETL